MVQLWVLIAASSISITNWFVLETISMSYLMRSFIERLDKSIINSFISGQMFADEILMVCRAQSMNNFSSIIHYKILIIDLIIIPLA